MFRSSKFLIFFAALTLTVISAMAADFDEVSPEIKKLVKQALSEADTQKSRTEKTQILRQLDVDLRIRLDKSDKFADLYFQEVLAPVFELAAREEKAINATSCQELKRTIERADLAHAPENASLLPETQLALQLLEKLCQDSFQQN